jgi:DNA-binding SARP family transcriptional activator/tetratricopeptide (TPR) repeat protein
LPGKSFCIRLLGTPEISWNSLSLNVPRRQARALLYRLAEEMQPVARDALLILLWPETTETDARRNLSRLLSALRRYLPHPDILQTTSTAVSLEPALTWSDAYAFVDLAAGAGAAQWQEAVGLYRGPFLSGFSLPNNVEFDIWQSRQQHAHEGRYLETLTKLVGHGCQTGQFGKATAFAQRYLAIDDLNEEMHRQLIALYAQMGNRSAALLQFEQCVMILERELGVAPLPETRAVYEAVRDGRPHTVEKAPVPDWAIVPGLDLPLLGRDTAMKELTEAYNRFRSGGAIFVSGEAGIGKSRLMQEFATTRASPVLSGNCATEKSPVPYQPLAQALRQALPLRTGWQSVQPIWLAELARMLPELHAHFTDLPRPVDDVEPQQAQARLFEALWQVFRSLAAESPLLLCLDDVHWADESTRGWLLYITRRLPGSQICILATYRWHERQALSTWQRMLKRAGLMKVVKLGGLTETAVLDLLCRLDNKALCLESLATRIHAATAGNAFFILETIRELLSADQPGEPVAELPLPATVRDAVLRRASRLTPLARQILEVTAVLSPVTDFDVIVEAAGRDELETASSLEELTACQLLSSAGEQFHFQHELAREVVYQDISAWRRRLLHRRAAGAMKMPLSGEKVGSAVIAFHFEKAGDYLPAIDHYRRAAEAARAVYAHREAINHLQHAITLANETQGAATVLPHLYEVLGDNLTIAGEFSTAEETCRNALQLMPVDDPLTVAELQRKLAATLPPQLRAREAEIEYRSALARLEGRPPQAVASQWQSTRLDILLGLLDALYSQNQPEKMAALKEETEALLDEVGTTEQQIDYLARLGQMSFIQNRFCVEDEHLGMVRRALLLAQEAGNGPLLARQQFRAGFCFLWYGNLNDAEEMLQQALEEARELGDGLLQNQCLVYLTILYRLQGSVAQVTSYQSHLIEVLQQTNSMMYLGVSQANAAWLHYRVGEWKKAQSQAEKAIATWSGYPFQWLAHWILLALALRQDRLPDAITAANAMLDVNQQKLPEEIDRSLATAFAAWDADDIDGARDDLTTAVGLASQYGYL